MPSAVSARRGTDTEQPIRFGDPQLQAAGPMPSVRFPISPNPRYVTHPLAQEAHLIARQRLRFARLWVRLGHDGKGDVIGPLPGCHARPAL